MVHYETVSYTANMKLKGRSWLRIRGRSAGFTLLEVMLAASLFSVVGMMSTGAFLNLSRGQQQVGSRNTLYDDAQFILDQLSKEISGGAIDYEEYYNRIVLGGEPGMNYGHYAAQFYYNLKNKISGCPVVDPSCVNTGKNPSMGNFPEKSNAFYQSGVTAGGIFCDGFEPIFSTSKGHACVTQLYIINPDGTKKTFIAPEKIYWDESDDTKISYVMSRAMMVGYEDAAKNTIPHVFHCENDDSACSGREKISTINISPPQNGLLIYYPDPADLLGQNGFGTPIEKAYNNGSDFVPFTPSRVNIKSIKFYISPAEDPHKGFSEANEQNGTVTNVYQPKVTIVLTLEPISNVKSGTSYPLLTAQTTVTPGLFAEVVSYPPQMVKKGK